MRRDVFHKYAAQSFPALFGCDEQHFEFPGFDACKGREAVFFVPYHIELLHAGQRLLAHHAAEKGDVLRGEEIVRGAYRPFPQGGKCVQLDRSRRFDAFDHWL